MKRHLNSKIVTIEQLIPLRDTWRRDGLRMVWTNGCFDILHAGHIATLDAASAFGDLLVVGINNDSSVKQLKGAGRPFHELSDRVTVISALEMVDFVVVYSDLLPTSLIAQLMPEVCCKGNDYSPPSGKPCPEASIVESYGGNMEYLPLRGTLSTTVLASKLYSAQDRT